MDGARTGVRTGTMPGRVSTQTVPGQYNEVQASMRINHVITSRAHAIIDILGPNLAQSVISWVLICHILGP